jgi:hypothetical protein
VKGYLGHADPVVVDRLVTDAHGSLLPIDFFTRRIC